MVLYDDYEKAGFFMLHRQKKDKGTALQIILYTVWLILASLLPVLVTRGVYLRQ
jgi:protoheme IX farnesyltransferase